MKIEEFMQCIAEADKEGIRTMAEFAKFYNNFKEIK